MLSRRRRCSSLLVPGLTIDIQKAFDQVWTDGLLEIVKAHRCGVGGRLYKWISYFLHNRKARVTVDGTPTGREVQMSTEPFYGGKSGRM